MSNNISSYQQTLDDLEFRRARSLDELRRIEAAMTGLRAAMEISVHMTPGPNSAIATPAEIRHEAQQRYSEMSVRWAVLKFLAEHSLQPQKTADISSALLEGGNPKASKATVSAVVSAMNKKNEVMFDPEAQ